MCMEGRKDVPYCMYCASMLLYFTRVSYQCHSGGCELVSDVKIFAGHDFQFFIIMVTLRLSYALLMWGFKGFPTTNAKLRRRY
jgi:hypothetical protein